MSFTKALVSGLLGACTLTFLHETARRLVPNAPRMDILGMRAISKLSGQGNDQPADSKSLHRASLLGDILANSLYYSLVGLGRNESVWLRGAGLGIAAGLGGILLPGPMGLGEEPSERSRATKVMTVGWYLAGAMAASAAYQLLTGKQDEEEYTFLA